LANLLKNSKTNVVGQNRIIFTKLRINFINEFENLVNKYRGEIELTK